VVDLARRRGLAGDRTIRQELARGYTRAKLLEYLGYRVRTAVTKGQQPGPESSVLKLMVSQHFAAKGDLVLALCGAGGMLAGDDAPEAGRWEMDFLGQWGARIGGGTDNIQRNTIGEKVLALPPEPRVDKGVPFRDILT
jgi:alkylation response protein AidB-like acyl-CoA dehydrogenase